MINDLLNIYGDEYSEEIFHLLGSGKEVDHKVAYNYLSKYYLSEDDLIKVWRPTMDRIFQNMNYGVSRMIFRDDYIVVAQRGGLLFDREEFQGLQRCLADTKDEYLIVVQNDFGTRSGIPLFRMVYPSNIAWDELTNGNYITTGLFEMPVNEYFVFGDSGKWGKYSANEAEVPVDLIGFHADVAPTFRKVFGREQGDYGSLIKDIDWLPPAYL